MNCSIMILTLINRIFRYRLVMGMEDGGMIDRMIGLVLVIRCIDYV